MKRKQTAQNVPSARLTGPNIEKKTQNFHSARFNAEPNIRFQNVPSARLTGSNIEKENRASLVFLSHIISALQCHNDDNDDYMMIVMVMTF